MSMRAYENKSPSFCLHYLCFVPIFKHRKVNKEVNQMTFVYIFGRLISSQNQKANTRIFLHKCKQK